MAIDLEMQHKQAIDTMLGEGYEDSHQIAKQLGLVHEDVEAYISTVETDPEILDAMNNHGQDTL